MSAEIKEILERLNKYVITPDVEDDFNNLKDYITNLQDKIDKAVEYIENNSHSNIKMNFIDKSGKIKCEFDNNVDPRDLLDILQGSDKE